jgi:coenzyme F420-reducing hydrogenase delta subunit
MKDKRKEADSHSQDAEGLAAINKVIIAGKTHFTSKEVHAVYNTGKVDIHKKSEGSIAKLISRLGFDNEKKHTGRVWIVDYELIKQKMEEFDMDNIEEGTSVPNTTPIKPSTETQDIPF